MCLILSASATWIGVGSGVALAAALIIYVSCTRPEKEPTSEYVFKRAELDRKESEFLKLVNGTRTGHTVRPDEFCSMLCEIHNRDMIRTGKIAHLDLGDATVDNTRFIELMGRGAKKYGEIIDYGFDNPGSAFKAFMRSPDHGPVVTDPDYNAVGISIVPDLEGNDYYTIIFIQI